MSRRDRPYPLLAGDVARTRVCVAIALPVVLALIFVIRDLDVPRVVFALGTFFVAWAIFCLVYLALALWVFLRADADTLARWLRQVPRPSTRGERISWALNGFGAIWWALSGGAVALVAMTVLITVGAGAPLAIVGAGVAVLVASWGLIAVSFALHYAREHALTGGLEFPGEAPRFSDFLYLALQLSTTSASSDVVLTTTRMRRLAALHGAIAFLFNTVIIAILVAVLLSAVS